MTQLPMTQLVDLLSHEAGIVDAACVLLLPNPFAIPLAVALPLLAFDRIREDCLARGLGEVQELELLGVGEPLQHRSAKREEVTLEIRSLATGQILVREWVRGRREAFRE